MQKKYTCATTTTANKKCIAARNSIGFPRQMSLEA